MVCPSCDDTHRITTHVYNVFLKYLIKGQRIHFGGELGVMKQKHRKEKKRTHNKHDEGRERKKEKGQGKLNYSPHRPCCCCNMRKNQKRRYRKT